MENNDLVLALALGLVIGWYLGKQRAAKPCECANYKPLGPRLKLVPKGGARGGRRC